MKSSAAVLIVAELKALTKEVGFCRLGLLISGNTRPRKLVTPRRGNRRSEEKQQAQSDGAIVRRRGKYRGDFWQLESRRTGIVGALEGNHTISGQCP
jgi:hypothetical protein